MRPSQVAWGPAFEHGFKKVLLVLEGVVEQRGVNADAKGDCLFCSLPGCLADGDFPPLISPVGNLSAGIWPLRMFRNEL